MNLTRRGFLITATGAAATVAFLPGCVGTPPVFQHGVASGDPLSDRVILWTRVTPGGTPASVTVQWTVADDPYMSQIVSRGSTLAVPGSDYTVKVDAVGLAPGRTYYYQFVASGWASPVGRTKTLPVGEQADRVRLGVVSCSSYSWGYFNAYGALSRRDDVDLVICLGDYYYEYEEGAYGEGAPFNRIAEPNNETQTLSDYRTRHAQYKGDPMLQEVHRQHPFVSIWDDHEFKDDSWNGGAELWPPSDPAGWLARRAAAVQAYYEWMPIRVVDPLNPLRTFRRFQFGNLLDLVMLDTRIYGRDQQALLPSFDPIDVANGSISDFLSIVTNPSREIIGAEQQQFLRDSLVDSQYGRQVPWRIVAQGVIMSPLVIDLPVPGFPVNPDQWDGYRGAQGRIYDMIQSEGIGNLVVLTGDVHSSWALEMSPDPYDPAVYDPSVGRNGIAVEFVCPSVSSPAAGTPGEWLAEIKSALGQAILDGTQPHLRWNDLIHRGYIVLDVTASHVQAEWYHTPDVRTPNDVEIYAKAVRVPSGSTRLEMDPPQTVASAAPRAPAPESPVTRWLRGAGGSRIDVA